MSNQRLADKFGLSVDLLNATKSVLLEGVSYQAKVKAHMAKKGIKSMSDMTADQKKAFFNELDAMHTAKNEEVEIAEAEWKMQSHADPKKAEKAHADLSQKHGKDNVKWGSKNKLGVHTIMVRTANESVKEEVEIAEAKVGDTVSYHHELKSAGVKVKKTGTVEKVEGDTIHVKEKDKYGVIRRQVKVGDLVKEETLDELNKDTLYSYKRKSEKDEDEAHKKLGKQIKSGDAPAANKTGKKILNRMAGQERAETRLNKEEVELDEGIFGDIYHGIKHSIQNLNPSTRRINKASKEASSTVDAIRAAVSYAKRDAAVDKYVKKYGKLPPLYDTPTMKQHLDSTRVKEEVELTQEDLDFIASLNASDETVSEDFNDLDSFVLEDIQAFMQTEDFEQLDELGKETLGNYIKKRSHDVATQGAITRQHAVDSRAEKEKQGGYMTRSVRDLDAKADKAFTKGWKHRQNIAKAVDKLVKKS